MFSSFARSIIAVAIVAGLAACSSRPVLIQVKPDAERIARELPIAGGWGEQVDGLQCRILLDSDRASETGILRGALAIQNTTAQPIELTATGRPPFSMAATSWALLNQPMLVDAKATAGEPILATLRLAPGEIYVTEPARLLVPAGEGPKAVMARMVLDRPSLIAAPLLVRISPAKWGQPINGLRVRIAPAQEACTVGQPPALHLFVQSLSNDPLSFRAPDWARLTVDQKDDLVILHVPTDAAAGAHIAPMGMWTDPITAPLLLAPGRYRLRLIIDAPELPADAPPAWHGQVMSNDATLEILAR